MDNGFQFDGQHSMNDWGVIAIKDAKRTIAAPGNVLAYAVGGLQGTMAFGDAQQLTEYTQVVNLYAARDLGSETAATELWRQLIVWLCAGRRALIWDSEPDKQVQAEVIEVTGEPSGWVEEGLKVSFRCQPLMRSVTPCRLAVDMTGDGWHDATMMVDTGLPAPVDLEVKNTGSAAITGMRAVVRGQGVRLDGLTLAQGDVLRISMEVPAGAEIVRADGSVENALPHAALFDRLEAAAGSVPVSVKVTGADVRAQACFLCRGVWR